MSIAGSAPFDGSNALDRLRGGYSTRQKDDGFDVFHRSEWIGHGNGFEECSRIIQEHHERIQ